MEAFGVHNPKSTPETRMRDRNRAEAVGGIEKILGAQPMLVAYVGAALVLAGIVESVYNP